MTHDVQLPDMMCNCTICTRKINALPFSLSHSQSVGILSFHDVPSITTCRPTFSCADHLLNERVAVFFVKFFHGDLWSIPHTQKIHHKKQVMRVAPLRQETPTRFWYICAHFSFPSFLPNVTANVLLPSTSTHNNASVARHPCCTHTDPPPLILILPSRR